jgi:ABC-2 type transport system ATP-binding protein
MIEVDSLTKRFASTTALSGVSFSCRRGEILGVLGPNGAGKTTTLRILCGFLPPSSGSASVDGLDVVERSLEVRRRVGYLPESNPLYPEMRVTEYLGFRAALKGVPRRARSGRLAEVVDQCGLAGIARKTIGTLSKGYRQRVGLADALVHQPELLVLDEPTSGLDPIQVVEVRNLIRSLAGGHTVLLSSHVLSEVEQICDRVLIFHEGRVVAQDSTERLRERVGTGTRITMELAPSARERVGELCDGIGDLSQKRLLDDGWLRAELEVEGDPREELFTRASALGITLRELSRHRPSLEHVFQELTSGRDRQHDGGER